MVIAKRNGRRIEIRSNARLTGLKEAVPGAYETVSGIWTVPLSVESCKLLRQKFGSQLAFTTNLQRWIANEMENRRYMSSLAKSSEAELRHLPKRAPKLYKAMQHRPYQLTGARFVADGKSVLVADEPGLGKTLIAMGGILEAGIVGPYLIVAPKTASEAVWRDEITRWLPDHYRVVTMPELRSEREATLRRTRWNKRTWLVIHPEMVQTRLWKKCACGKFTGSDEIKRGLLACGHAKQDTVSELIDHSYPILFDQEWGVIVLDESHEALIRRKGEPTQARRGLDMLRLRDDGMRVALSGTPFNSKPHQLWGTLNWLDSKTYSAFYRWAETYWQRGGYTGYDIGDFRQDREKMLWASLTTHVLRRTKAEVAKDLPAKAYVGTRLHPVDESSPLGIWLPMSDKQATAYVSMEKLAIARLDSGELHAISALAELTRLKQLACSFGDVLPKVVSIYGGSKCCRDCATVGSHRETRYHFTPKLPSNKIRWVLDSLEEWGFPDNPLTKVVIVSQFTSLLNLTAEAINRHFRKELTVSITGQTHQADRRNIIRGFNSDNTHSIMLLNVKAGGVAITLDSADRMIFLSETRIPDQQAQAEDRIHRVSNPRQCMYYYLRSLETIDVGTAEINQQLDAQTKRLLDKRRGVDYFQSVIDLAKTARYSIGNREG